MKRFVLLLVIILISLTACAGDEAAVQESVQVIATPDLGPTPTARIVMHASDPAEFVQASGKPQLVEFFTFW